MAFEPEPSPAVTAPLDMGVRFRLSVMMFLQFAIWGSWATIIGNYLKHLNFAEDQVGWIGSLMPLGGMIGPMLLILSQAPDRFVASERLLGVLHLLGAGCLYWIATLQGQADYGVLIVAMTLYALLYNATLALANSITFTHVQGERDFPGIRVMGTLGWIAAGLALDYVLGTKERPVFQSNIFLMMAAVLSVVLGVFSFALPHTPPSGKKGDALPFLKAVGLFKDPSFAVFFGVSFVITVVLAFYFSFTGTYLEKAQAVQGVASTMILGQVAEIAFLVFLPFFLRTMGIKGVLAVGMLAWGVRYALFALAGNDAALSPLVTAGILLHGICFDFFFAAAFIYVDTKAPKDIRPSSQALFSFLTYGAGLFIGNVAAGYLAKGLNVFDDPSKWSAFWWAPSIGVLLSLAVFLVAFRVQPKKATESAAPD